MDKIYVRFAQPTEVGPGVETKITQIKALRAATGCGLKEAKDAVEASYTSGKLVELTIVPGKDDDEKSRRRHALVDLRQMETVTVSGAGEDVLRHLNSLVRLATEKGGAYDLAGDLLEVLKRHDV